MEGIHTMPDGLQVYTKTWKVDQPRAILVFIHGFSDHCNAYYDLFPTLASSSIEVRAFDQRGWGRTVTKPHDRGNTGPTGIVHADMHSFLQSTVQQSVPQTPIFLMGHSMGGGQVLTYTLHPDSPFHDHSVPLAGVLAYAPLIALDPAYRPSSLYLAGGRLAARIIPRYQRLSPIDPALMSRDEKVVADYAADPLCHDMGTLEGLAGMLERAQWLEQMMEVGFNGKRCLPMWFSHGEDDRVTSCAATRRFAGVVGEVADVVFCSYEGAFHNLHAELVETKTRFARDLIEWVLAKSAVGLEYKAKL